MDDIVKKIMLTGKNAIITGGHSGIGRGITEALSQAGANLVIVGRRKDLGEKVAREVAENNKVTADFVTADITREEDITKVVDFTMEKYGKIDILVNNAGIAHHENAEDINRENWRKVMAINVDALFFLSQAVGRVMIRQKYGNIVNISSNSDNLVMTPQTQTVYNAAKAGVDMVTKCLAYEWAQYNIRVNAIAPGYISTDLLPDKVDKNGKPWKDTWHEMIPVGRFGKPEEIGAMVLYIASDMSPFLTGSVLLMDGGYSLT
jgi:NAD(P)-dependent dehydrogenase (short-subunit alcohol dehydrogenase family)